MGVRTKKKVYRYDLTGTKGAKSSVLVAETFLMSCFSECTIGWYGTVLVHRQGAPTLHTRSGRTGLFTSSVLFLESWVFSLCALKFFGN